MRNDESNSIFIIHHSSFLIHHSLSLLKHVLFDNDGTLVDSEIIAVRTMLSLLRPHGFEMHEDAFGQRYTGLLERDILAHLNREFGLVVGEDFQKRLHHLHIEAFDRDLRAISGMPTVFRRLKIPKSMVSNASRRHVERCLRRVRLHSALDGHIFSAEQVERPKPHPDLYHFALESLGLKPGEVVVVEDSITGVRAAAAAGLTVVGFLGAAHISDGHETKLLEAGAQLIAQNAKALTVIFEGMGAM